MGPGVSDLLSPRYPNGLSELKFTLRFRPHADDQRNWQVGHTKTILLFHICTVVGEVASRNRREKIPPDEWVIYFSFRTRKLKLWLNLLLVTDRLVKDTVVLDSEFGLVQHFPLLFKSYRSLSQGHDTIVRITSDRISEAMAKCRHRCVYSHNVCKIYWIYTSSRIWAWTLGTFLWLCPFPSHERQSIFAYH